MASKLESKNDSANKRAVNKLLKKGDEVIVISGGHSVKRPVKGKIGKIVSFEGDYAIVEGLNVITKHQKQTAPGKPSGRISREAPIHCARLAYYANALSKPVQLKIRVQDGKKVRGYITSDTKEFVAI